MILRRRGVKYWWGFPFKLFFESQGTNVVISTVQEVELFFGENRGKVRYRRSIYLVINGMTLNAAGLLNPIKRLRLATLIIKEQINVF